MHGTVSPDHMNYFRRREAQERAAAKCATTLAARGVHQELAQLYAELVSRSSFSTVPPPER
jgi:hypothetical protein